MTVNRLKASTSTKPAALTSAQKVTQPFTQASAALGSARVKEALAGMNGQTPKQLAASIRAELPELAKPLAEMIRLLNRPERIVAEIPATAAAEKLANSGWKMLDKLVEVAKPALPPSRSWQADTRSDETKRIQLVNLVKSALAH